MLCNECKSAVYCIMRYQNDINTEHNDEVNMPRGSGSLDKAPDSQWANASLNSRGAHF